MQWLPRLVHALARLSWWVSRPLTVGVRGLLIRDGAILLVRHTYQAHWYLPGGGVKKGETLEAAVRREAAEEAGAQLGVLELAGVYSGFFEHKSDHVVVFRCHDFALGEHRASREIEAVKFFPLDALPADISPGSKRRIEEYLRGNRSPTFGVW